MTVDSVKFGQTMQKVDDLIPLVEKHIDKSDQRHLDAEKRIQMLEEERRFNRRVIAAIIIAWTFLGPILRELLLNVLFKGGDGLQSLLTFHNVINNL